MARTPALRNLVSRSFSLPLGYSLTGLGRLPFHFPCQASAPCAHLFETVSGRTLMSTVFSLPSHNCGVADDGEARPLFFLPLSFTFMNVRSSYRASVASFLRSSLFLSLARPPDFSFRAKLSSLRFPLRFCPRFALLEAVRAPPIPSLPFPPLFFGEPCV